MDSEGFVKFGTFPPPIQFFTGIGMPVKNHQLIKYIPTTITLTPTPTPTHAMK